MSTTQGDLHPHASANTYPGYRSDLRTGEEDAVETMDIDEIKKLAKANARQEMGVTAYMLSKLANCSKEWARKILNRMHSDGELTCKQHGQLKLFGLPDIPCPHCGEMMSAYRRSGACSRCESYGGGR